LKQFMRSMLILLIFWAIVFNIEKLAQISDQTVPGIHLFVLILMPIIGILIIFIPFFQRQNLIFSLLGAFILFLILSVATNTQPFSNFFLTLIEVILLLAGTYLAHLVANNFLAVQYSIENVILPKHGHRVYDDRDMAKRIIEHEFIRGRRYNHPITAVILEPNQSEMNSTAAIEQVTREIQEAIKGHYYSNKIMQVLENETRLTDLVVEWDKQGRFVIICPETTAESSTKLVDRLQSAVKENLGLSIAYGIASFPNDARTFEAVLEKAEEHLISPDGLLLQYTKSADKAATL